MMSRAVDHLPRRLDFHSLDPHDHLDRPFDLRALFGFRKKHFSFGFLFPTAHDYEERNQPNREAMDSIHRAHIHLQCLLSYRLTHAKAKMQLTGAPEPRCCAPGFASTPRVDTASRKRGHR